MVGLADKNLMAGIAGYHSQTIHIKNMHRFPKACARRLYGQTLAQPCSAKKKKKTSLSHSSHTTNRNKKEMVA